MSYNYYSVYFIAFLSYTLGLFVVGGFWVGSRYLKHRKAAIQ